MCKATGFLPKIIFNHPQKIKQRIVKEMIRAQWHKGARAQRHVLELGLDIYQIKKESISLH
jgi:hypothetical protein